MIKDFEGKVAVVTGAANGIGRSLVHAFAKRGMKIVLADIDKEALEKVEQELKDTGTEVIVQVTDVSKQEEVAALADTSYKHFGKVNVLCNNAGICHSAPIRSLSLEDWNWALNVNFRSVIYGVHFFLNRMLESKESCHIVNSSSDMGLTHSRLAPYSITKHAIVALSETLVTELNNTNVGVSVLCPGWVDTELLENTETLGRQHSGVLEMTPEVFESLNLTRESIDNAFKSGLNPDIIAEKTIKAIEEGIFYIVTHPEEMQSIQARFERIQEDSMKLNRNKDNA